MELMPPDKNDSKWNPARGGVSVVIPTQNRAAVLEKVLRCLQDQTLSSVEYEVIVVDDGSSDDTAAAVADLVPEMDYSLKCLRNEVSLGVSGATNRGIREARGDVVVIINDDALADRRLLEEHLAAHERRGRMVYCGQVFNVPVPERGRLHPLAPWLKLSFAFFCGTNVSVHRRDLLEAGLYDENIRYGYEDLELGFRLARAGLHSKLNRRCIVFHYKKEKDPLEYLAGLSGYARELGRGAAYYYWKHRRLGVMTTTGLFPWTIRLHRKLFSGGGLARLLRRLLERPLPSFVRLLPGIILYRLEFHDAACRRLDELEAGAADGRPPAKG